MSVSNVSAAPWCSSVVQPKQKYPMSIFYGCGWLQAVRWPAVIWSSSIQFWEHLQSADWRRRPCKGRFTFCMDNRCLISEGQPRDAKTVTDNYHVMRSERFQLGSLRTWWSNEAQSWSSSEPSHSTCERWTFKNGGKFWETGCDGGDETHLASREKSLKKNRMFCQWAFTSLRVLYSGLISDFIISHFCGPRDGEIYTKMSVFFKKDWSLSSTMSYAALLQSSSQH